MKQKALILFVTLALLIFSGCATIQSDYISAQRINSIESYEKFLSKYPNSEYEKEVRERIEQLEWQRAKSANTVASYENYLKMYPSGKFKTNAKASIEKLYWKIAKKNNTIASYKEYIKRYPQGTFISDAISRIEELNWQHAKALNTIDAYEKYLSKYPTGNFIEEAKRKISYITKKQKEAIKKKEFSDKLAKAKNQREIKKIIEDYSEYDFADNAIPILEDSIIEKIKKHGIKNRFIIRQIKPIKNAYVCRVTLKPYPEGELELLAKCRIVSRAFNKQGFLTAILVCRGPSIGPGFLVTTEYPADSYYKLMSEDLKDFSLMGKGSIHRIDGKVKHGGYTFIGEGDQYNRLTFVLLNQGYIYVRGIGRVITPTGKTIKLGY